VNRLERRFRLLLLAYPADYRHVRGEEIIGTLLEATPEGRSWPLPRDARALIMGGLHARAALNRSRTAPANLRIAVLVGVTAYLCLDLGTFVRDLVRAGPPHAWPAILVPLAFVLVVAVAWTSRWRLLVLAAALPALAFVCRSAFSHGWAQPLPMTLLVALLLLVALGGGSQRPDARWLLPLGTVAVLLMLPDGWFHLGVLLVVILAVGSLAWIAIDARPALAAVVVLLGLWLPGALKAIRFGGVQTTLVPVVPVAAVIVAVAFWRLRRQSGQPNQGAQ
jgi:hypothetical protein